MTSLDTAAVATPDTLRDRIDITDALYRYASSIDRFDWDGVRSVLHDELWAQYGNAEPLVGGDEVVAWIAGFCETCIWQHHLLSVYHVDVEGDRATALVYHTSYQLFEAAPDTVHQLVARYHVELARTASGWRIARLVMEILWGERRKDTTGYLDEVGGRGPAID